MEAQVRVTVPVLGFSDVVKVLLTTSDKHVRVDNKLLPDHTLGVEADQTAASIAKRTRSRLSICLSDSKLFI